MKFLSMQSTAADVLKPDKDRFRVVNCKDGSPESPNLRFQHQNRVPLRHRAHRLLRQTTGDPHSSRSVVQIRSTVLRRVLSQPRK